MITLLHRFGNTAAELRIVVHPGLGHVTTPAWISAIRRDGQKCIKGVMYFMDNPLELCKLNISRLNSMKFQSIEYKFVSLPLPIC